MAPAFMVSAPGKVIVFGEHAAVFYKPAIAAAISLRSYLLVTTLSKSQRIVTLNFKDIGLHHTWPIDSLPWHIFHHPAKKRPYHSPVNTLDPELLDAITPHAAAVSMAAGIDDELRKIHVRSATAFLYLFLSLGSPRSPGFVYTLRSTIPIGAGLGSSASVCVCLSAALLLQIQALAGPHPDQPETEAGEQIKRINHWAYVGELCIHGDPSGVDNTVASRGKALLYRKNVDGQSSVIPLTNFPTLQFLLIDTKQQRSTATQVQKVHRLRENNPTTVNLILDAIGTLTESALDLFSANESTSFNDDSLDRFGAMIQINQGLLDALSVSHHRIERVRELTDSTNIGWTKLTGAGGGGCTMTLLRSNVSEETVHKLDLQLTKEGFELHRAVLGAQGVGVLWPAVFRTGPGSKGEEIDQALFERAVGMEGIEQLVGVGGREDCDGWRFWTQLD